MVNFLTKLKHFDAYPKPLEDFRIKTISGAIITSITTVIIIILFLYEWKSYVTIDVDQELFVDLTRHQKLTINLNLTFTHLPCDLLSLDAMDVSGEHQNDVVKGLKKTRLDREGKAIPDDSSHHGHAETSTTTTTTTSTNSMASSSLNNSIDLYKCLSCYGAEAANIKCCNTCDDVRRAYRQKNWHFTPVGVEQCKDELSEAGRNIQASALSKDSEAIAKLISSGEGCQLIGHLEVNKVAGNFHIAPGISYQQEHMHVHDIKHMPLDKFNTAHFFEVFSFGDEYPNQFNPLERKNLKPEKKIEKVDNENENKVQDFIQFDIFQFFQADFGGSNNNQNGDSYSYSYFLKVVPTTYEYLDGRIVNNTYQYSVTRSKKLITGASLFGSQLPGIFVNYELSPIMVKYVEKSKSFSHFITGCCAIIGGLFTVAGMFDAFTFKYYNMYKKHQMNKLT